MPADVLELNVIRKLDDIENIRSFWEQNESFPDMDLELYCEQIRSSNGQIRPLILTLYKNGQPQALIAGRIKAEVPNWKIGYLAVCRRPVQCLEIAYAGILGQLSAADGQLFVEQLLAELGRGQFSFLKVSYLATSSPIYPALRNVLGPLSREVMERNQHWVLDFPATYEEFYKSRSSNTKSNIRQYNNRIRKKFGDSIRITHFRHREDIPAAIEAIEKIASRTYHRRLIGGFTDTPELRSMWAFAAERGWLSVHVMHIDEQPIAFWSGYVYKKRYILHFTGYDPDYHYFHPGMHLLLRMFEEFCESQEVKTFDYGFSHEDYKRHLGTRATEEASIYVFAPTFNGTRLSATQLLTSGTTQAVKYILMRTNMLNRFKKGLKRWATQ